jgi:hypothetical protein
MNRIVTFLAVLTLCACSGDNGGGTGGGSATGGGHATGGGSSSSGGGSGSTGGGTASTGGGSGATGGGTASTGGGSGATGGGSGATGGGSGATGGGSGAFSCSGMALPTTAPAMITVSGKTVAAGSSATPTPVAGATVTALKNGTMMVLGMATSAADGSFTINVTTGGAPVDLFLHVTAMSRTDSYWWPTVPASANLMTGDINLFDSLSLFGLGGVAGIVVDNTKTQVFMDLRDCQDNTISGGTVTVSPMPEVTRYIANNSPSSTATATDSSGACFLGNLPAGDTTFGGMSGMTTLRSHHATAVAGSVMMVGVQP